MARTLLDTDILSEVFRLVELEFPLRLANWRVY
jgi:hypothetical protein